MNWSTALDDASGGQELCRHEVQEPAALEVIVRSAMSPLETDSLFGRGRGVLAAHRSVAVTFLLGHQDFVTLRDRMLHGGTEISFSVRAVDVIALHLGAPDAGTGPPASAQARFSSRRRTRR